MSSNEASGDILAVRLGAMGDVIHALPAVASLKASFPNSRLTWVVDAAWMPLLHGNPFVDTVIPFDRKHPRKWFATRRDLLRSRYAVAVDFQGLLKSALVAKAAKPERIVGFGRSEIRERAAAMFYSQKVQAGAVHAVERNLALARAAGASSLPLEFPLPQGRAEDSLPRSEFVLASPFAGWTGKQWPLEYYAKMAELLDVPLVLNGPPQARDLLDSVPGALTHTSGIEGLIYATRRATAVIGVDSGPMHLAAALNKPGVAIFGPTDPARNGPYGNTLQVLRHPSAALKLQPGGGLSGAYIRGRQIDSSMRLVSPTLVLEMLKQQVACLA